MSYVRYFEYIILFQQLEMFKEYKKMISIKLKYIDTPDRCFPEIIVYKLYHVSTLKPFGLITGTKCASTWILRGFIFVLISRLSRDDVESVWML